MPDYERDTNGEIRDSNIESVWKDLDRELRLPLSQPHDQFAENEKEIEE